VSFALVPHASVKPFATDENGVMIKRAGFVKHSFWVTPFHARQRYHTGLVQCNGVATVVIIYLFFKYFLVFVLTRTDLSCLNRFSGEYPVQRAWEDGLAKWVEENRNVTNTDIVVWHTFGITHVVRCEDYPVMPIETTGFIIKPVNFFDRNPAIDHLPHIRDAMSRTSKL
jgi:primary-amine oxidase